jgi:hypothetical protein
MATKQPAPGYKRRARILERKIKRSDKGKRTKFRDFARGEDRKFSPTDRDPSNIVDVPRRRGATQAPIGGTGDYRPKKGFFQTKRGYAKKYATHMPEYTRHYDAETKTYRDEKTGPQQLTFKRGRKTVTYDVSPGSVGEKRIRIKTPKTVLPSSGGQHGTVKRRVKGKGKLRNWVRSKRERDVTGREWSAGDTYAGKGKTYDPATGAQTHQGSRVIGYNEAQRIEPLGRYKGKSGRIKEGRIYKGDLKGRKQKQEFKYRYRPGKGQNYGIGRYSSPEQMKEMHSYKEDPKSRFNSGGRVRGFREGGILDQHD